MLACVYLASLHATLFLHCFLHSVDFKLVVCVHQNVLHVRSMHTCLAFAQIHGTAFLPGPNTGFTAMPCGTGFSAARKAAQRGAKRTRTTQHSRQYAPGFASKAAGVPAMDFAARQLRHVILSKYALGRIFATDVASLSFWIDSCGIPYFSDLALDPASPWFEKNASRKVSAATEFKAIEAAQYMAEIPMSDDQGNRAVALNSQRQMSTRRSAFSACALFIQCTRICICKCYKVWTSLPMNLIHEMLADDFNHNPSPLRDATQLLATSNWSQNDVVRQCQESGDEAIAYGHFVDAAPYKRKMQPGGDSVLCYYINPFGLRTRRTVMVLTKDYMCGERCGCPCRGRCTIAAAGAVIVWSANCAAIGKYPLTRHDGLPFADLRRRERAGKPLCESSPNGVRFVLIEYRADWEQFSSGLGMICPYARI